jgi:hypothetical protein
MRGAVSARSLRGNSKEEWKMPRVSRVAAEHVDDHGVVEDRHEDIDGYTVTSCRFARM